MTTVSTPTIRALHASPDAPPVDVYVTALNADLDGEAPVNGATTPLAFEDYTGRLQVPAGDYQLRITHASPSTPVVDLYLVPAGTDIAGTAATFEDVPFGADTTQLSVAAGNYDAYVTLADSKTPAISLPGLVFGGGEVLDVIARDPIAADGETLPQAVVIDYSAVPVCPAP